MVVAGVPPPPQRAPSDVSMLTGAHSLLRLDSWRLPAPGGIPGRAGSEVFIDTEKLPLSTVTPQLQSSLSYAPSEGPDAALAPADSFFPGAGGDGSQDGGLQRGPSEAMVPSTSAAARQPDDRAGFRLLPSPSEDERDWKATLNKAFGEGGDQGEPGLLAPRPSNLEINAARTNAAALRASRDAAAEKAAHKQAKASNALKAQDVLNNVLLSGGASGASRARPEHRAPASASMPAPGPRRAPAAPATNALKRLAGASAEAPEPAAKKHRAELALAQQETPITDAAMKMMKEEGLTLNSVKATDHWTDPAGRKCRRGCLYCQMQKTPQWRQGPLGPKTLCNACGVRYRKEVEILAARQAQGGAAQ